MKRSKGSGRSIIATARKVAVIIWHMLSEDVEFDEAEMADRKLAKKAFAMSATERLAKEAVAERHEKPVAIRVKAQEAKKTGVARKKREKVG
jgi:hypothetical protein